VTANNLFIDNQNFSSTNVTSSFTGITSIAGPTATGAAGKIMVTANNANIINNGTITSQNQGSNNAGQVVVTAHGALRIENAAITTIAAVGDGGPITLITPVLTLANGQITTSAHKLGNGGSIEISGRYLIMDTGFIQANTAQGAKGGNINIREFGVIASNNDLAVGGQERELFVANSGHNVIQAAAPEGISGNISLTVPDAAAAADLVAVAYRNLDTSTVSNPCTGRNICRTKVLIINK
ncbi:hypothetical protein TI04_13085, partial [Achromatium sp. WMS2]